jgi:hypothetical protein
MRLLGAPRRVVGGGALLATLVLVGGFVVANRSGDHSSSATVAVVWGNPIPRSLFRKGMAIRIKSAQAQTGHAPRPGTSAYRSLQDETMRQLVNDVVVVAEARRLGVVEFAGPVAEYVVHHPAQTTHTWPMLYDFAARTVPEPGDPKVVRATTFDEDALPDLLTPKQLHEYYAWQARRDRVASAWFKRLFRRYAAHTTYSSGFRPAGT